MFDWETFSFVTWEFLNSPIVIALGGGLAAKWLAARWQKKAQQFEMQLRVYQDLNSQFIDWMKAKYYDREEEQDDVSQRNLITSQLVRVLFGEESWKAVAEVRNAMSGGRNKEESGVDFLIRVSFGIKFQTAMRAMARDMGLRFAAANKNKEIKESGANE